MLELTLNKRCNAPVARVFAAWSSSEQIKHLFAHGDMTVPEAEVDFRVGGAYRIVMQRPDGQTYIVGGIYRDIVTNRRLCFTWCWDGSEVNTEVEVTFRPDGDRTDVTLTHRQFANAEIRDRHNQGWEGCLANLAQLGD
jgi:uncharacterized protein YndB with AHSA1/START domain